jgi:hypothetical protein
MNFVEKITQISLRFDNLSVECHLGISLKFIQARFNDFIIENYIPENNSYRPSTVSKSDSDPKSI